MQSTPQRPARKTQLSEKNRRAAHNCNPEAEICLLGSLLYDSTYFGDISSVLKEEYFYDARNAKAFAAMREVYRKNDIIDAMLLKQELVNAEMFDFVGGDDYIADIASDTVGINSREYASIVRDYGLRRQLKFASDNCIEMAKDGSISADEIVEKSINTFLELNASTSLTKAKKLSAVTSTLYEKFQRKEQTPGIMTGYEEIDELTNGLKAGELIVLAARTSVGKTTFAMNISRNTAKLGNPALFFSLEMDEEEMTSKVVSAEANVKIEHMIRGSLTEEDWNKLTIAEPKLNNLEIEIVDKPGQTITQIHSHVKRWARATKKMGLIVIDYLQIIGREGRRGNKSRQEEIGEWTCRLKALAREVKMPIILIAQLNRETDKRGGTPRLTDLRESGDIEQDADIIFLLETLKQQQTMNSRFAGQQIQTDVKVHVPKNRKGRKGEVVLSFEPMYCKFKGLEEKYGG